MQTVKNAERIIVLERGAVVQDGEFETLVGHEGRFRQLWEEQTRQQTPAA